MKLSIFIAAFAAETMATRHSEALEPRDTTICGQWDNVKIGPYTVYQDLWGMDSGTGSQCTTVGSLSGTTLSWSTSWSWSGGSSNVKSFANVVTDITVAQLSSFKSIPSTWTWSYTGNSIVADVAYDMFTSSSSGGSAEYEVMIWLAALGGAGPISSTGSPIATPTINGVTWKLYSGYNGAMHVFSFVAPSSVQSFKGDLVSFFTYLESSQGMPSSQYLQSIGAGTEPFTGSNAVFTVSAFSLTTS
ncbi:glycoside hydrolase family 12 protein [Hypoxylon sp. FL0890]|nr:glycoside hydrolase family 12 protein [Hypoxylon sp. FL0890]